LKQRVKDRARRLRRPDLFAGEERRNVGAETDDSAIIIVAAAAGRRRRTAMLFAARLVTRFMTRFWA
jgi:hypothetical protein